MLLYGFLGRSNGDLDASVSELPVFIMENPNISCRIDFTAKTEDDFVNGVLEMLRVHVDESQQCKVTVMGHSFGTVMATWLRETAHFWERIQQMIYIDPVSILLHKSDVPANFLHPATRQKENTVGSIIAGSELFTQCYLRRKLPGTMGTCGWNPCLMPFVATRCSLAWPCPKGTKGRSNWHGENIA
jgi:pimeloyl-ACP methyl ester carboxylesterase